MRGEVDLAKRALADQATYLIVANRVEVFGGEFATPWVSIAVVCRSMESIRIDGAYSRSALYEFASCCTACCQPAFLNPSVSCYVAPWPSAAFEARPVPKEPVAYVAWLRRQPICWRWTRRRSMRYKLMRCDAMRCGAEKNRSRCNEVGSNDRSGRRKLQADRQQSWNRNKN